jgi:predicted TIM-barrel fold metal-dependent hydrolase
MAQPAHRIFDCDVHHHFPSSAAIERYLPEGAPAEPYYAGGSGLPHVDGAFRIDTYPPTGGPPCSDPEYAAHDLLDRHGIDYAILSCGSLLGLSDMHDVDRAARLASAINDWTINDWFPVDGRFLGSISVATSDPVQAAAEIRRVGTNPRLVQVCATGLPCLMGNPFLHPIYEACEEVGLPFTLHQGGLQPTPAATPTSFVEHHIDMCFPALPHVVSLVTEGVFVKYPRLTVVLNEFGIAWVPFVLWRLDMEYRAGRDELPWLTRLPSEYITDHLRFSTQPLEEPSGDPRDLLKLLETFDAKHMLMFSSDYPHWDADNPDVVLRRFPEEWQQRIFWDNAIETFGIGERLGSAAALAGAV